MIPEPKPHNVPAGKLLPSTFGSSFPLSKNFRQSIRSMNANPPDSYIQKIRRQAKNKATEKDEASKSGS